MKSSTTDLLKTLRNGRDISAILQKNRTELVNTTIAQALCRLIEQKGLKKADVVRNSLLNRTYAYDILNGARLPGRDKVLQLCFSMGLEFEEVQALLKQTGFAQLYARNRRDSILIFGFEQHLSVIRVDELLNDMNEPTLQTSK